jgi:hypothetical protein
MTHGKLTLGQRAFLLVWEPLVSMSVGAPNPLMKEAVLTFGVREYLKGVKMMYEVLGLLEKRWGTLEAQLIIAFAGLWSGCRWCSVGHVYAANLELFKREGELLPLDEREIPELQTKTDAEILELMEARFCAPRWEEMVRMLHQQYLLRSGQAEEVTRDDQLLQMANAMWEWFNDCSITVMDIDPLTIPQQSFLGRDHGLLERYRKARDHKPSIAER